MYGLISDLYKQKYITNHRKRKHSNIEKEKKTYSRTKRKARNEKPQVGRWKSKQIKARQRRLKRAECPY